MNSIVALHDERSLIIVAHPLRVLAMRDRLFLLEKDKVVNTSTCVEVMEKHRSHQLGVRWKK